MFWFVLLLILMGGAFYFYQRMRALEQQIRADQALEKERQQSQQQKANVPGSSAVSEASEKSAPVVEPESTTSGGQSVDSRQPVISAIQSQPGVLQTDIYGQLPQLSKRQVQQLIRQLTDEGKIRRERSGSSYQLYLT